MEVPNTVRVKFRDFGDFGGRCDYLFKSKAIPVHSEALQEEVRPGTDYFMFWRQSSRPLPNAIATRPRCARYFAKVVSTNRLSEPTRPHLFPYPPNHSWATEPGGRPYNCSSKMECTIPNVLYSIVPDAPAFPKCFASLTYQTNRDLADVN